MLLMMLGDINIGMIFPSTTHINLEKKELKEDAEDDDTYKSSYGGNSDDEQNYLQFSGETWKQISVCQIPVHGNSSHITGTAHVFFAAYAALFAIVIMNLLIGLAVADIDALLKKARRENIISQIELIYDMMEIRVTPIYRHCAPECLKKLYER